jgi:hypothetical protein
MLTPRRISTVLEQGKGASNAGPLALHPLPRFGGNSHRKETTRHRCTRFQDHPVLETVPHFRIILGLEYAVPEAPGKLKHAAEAVAGVYRRRGSSPPPLLFCSAAGGARLERGGW